MGRVRDFLSIKSAFVIFSFLAFLNITYLDIVTLKNIRSAKPTVTQSPLAPLPSVVPSASHPATQAGELCPQDCLTQIYQATASLKLQSQTLPPVTSSVKEFFVPFGSGSNSSDDWQDVFGLKAAVDAASYPQIKSVVFEASVHIPTGNQTAYVRLFNVTDKHPVWFSEVSIEGGTPQLLVSKPITLDPGNKEYQVQMKTSLKFPAILDQARLHIITK